MGHIFISYSHKDTKYAHGLADHLKNMGFETWIDERLDYGSQWPHELQKQLDSCDAFILIMTPRSFASDWVQSELQRARRKLKPIFPLLLEGEEPWLSVESTQYYDVRGGIFPDDRFYSAIKRVVSTSLHTTTLNRLPKPAVKTRPTMKTEVLIAIIGGVATVIAACATIVASLPIWKPLEPSLTEPLAPVGVVMQSTQPQPVEPSETFVPSPTVTSTLLPTQTSVPPTLTLPPTNTAPPTITPTQPIPQEEYVDTSYMEQNMHACATGFAVAGVRLDRNELLCRRVMRRGEESFVASVVDEGQNITARYEMHACPEKMYLRGFDADQNRFLCSYDSRNNPPREWRNEVVNSVDQPGSVGHDMHICPLTGDNITYLTGLRADQNLFLCAIHVPY